MSSRIQDAPVLFLNIFLKIEKPDGGTSIAKSPRVSFLAKTKPGRVVLHAVCALRNPRRARWHLRGILRELNPF